MLEALYAKAMTDLLNGPAADPAKLAAGLRRTLTQRGHMALLPRIVAHITRNMHSRQGEHRLFVKVARAQDMAAATAKAKEVAGGRPTEIVEDASLIAGFCLEGPGFRYDASARSALMNLYRTLAK